MPRVTVASAVSNMSSQDSIRDSWSLTLILLEIWRSDALQIQLIGGEILQFTDPEIWGSTQLQLSAAHRYNMWCFASFFEKRRAKGVSLSRGWVVVRLLIIWRDLTSASAKECGAITSRPDFPGGPKSEFQEDGRGIADSYWRRLDEAELSFHSCSHSPKMFRIHRLQSSSQSQLKCEDATSILLTDG